MRYGYARVSTVRQGKDGNSLDDQRNKLINAGAEQILEDSFTGSKIERPEFSKLIEIIQPGDTLYVTKLDRFARTAAEGSMLVKALVDKGVIIEILNMGRADNRPMGRLLVNVMLAFAEFERDMIVERTQTGKAIAREKGVRVDGRPKKFPPAQMEHAMLLLKEHSYNHVSEITGISRSTLIRERNRRKAAEISGIS